MNATQQTATFACECGIKSDARTFLPIVTYWVKSPRTGRVVSFAKTEAYLLPARVTGKIAKARSEGKAVAEFTREELSAVASIEDSRPQFAFRRGARGASFAKRH